MMWFSIDVETTGTNPLDPAHKLATVGAVALSEDGLFTDSFYERLIYPDSWDEDTKAWWLQQNSTAKREMFTTEGRMAPGTAAHWFADWVQELTDDAVFVANPSTFDHAWVQRWLTDAGIPMPFSHRTLCLRSADWGNRRGAPWGESRQGHRPLIPHHALHDAQAQALDLLDLLASRR